MYEPSSNAKKGRENQRSQSMMKRTAAEPEASARVGQQQEPEDEDWEVVKELRRACNDGNAMCVRRILEQHPHLSNGPGMDNTDHIGRYMDTPFIIAARGGNTEIMKIFLEKGADVNQRKARYNETALHAAASLGHLEAMKLLLDRGADINVQDADGQVPLNKAAMNGYKEIVELLLDRGADPNIASNYGRAALHSFAIRGYTELMRRLLLEGRADVTAVDCWGSSVLHLASHNGHIEIVRLLMSMCPEIDINPKDRDGETPLLSADANGYRKVVKLLLYGADPTLQYSENNIPLLKDVIGTLTDTATIPSLKSKK